MKSVLRLVGGFSALATGVIITLPLPEFGIPMILLGTRLLGDRYKWAKSLNSKVDLGWAKAKAKLKKAFGR
ncbi:unannotated protein [freshwater metagenome]|uniref:Unannotated protein n=1 Tax=freshwater metagenome TaxID=449393 RepID=A0A6J7FVR8_9ZZZZ|nr:hypothetical protein [Actinomycetota bacterium]